MVDNNAETEDLAAWNPHWQLDSGQCSLRWSEIKQWKCFSRILLRIGSKDIGLKSFGPLAPCFFGMGTTLEHFHAVGGRPS